MSAGGFGQRLRAIREGRLVRDGTRIGIRQLARLSGKSPTWITQLETGKRWRDKLPPLDDLTAIARALDLTVDQLVGARADEQPTPGERPGGLSEWVRRLRDRRGLGRQELGRAVGRSESWIANLEAGEIAEPPRQVVAALARALGVSPEELAGGELPGPRSDRAVQYESPLDSELSTAAGGSMAAAPDDPAALVLAAIDARLATRADLLAGLERLRAEAAPEVYQALVERVAEACLGSLGLAIETFELRRATTRPALPSPRDGVAPRRRGRVGEGGTPPGVPR